MSKPNRPWLVTDARKIQLQAHPRLSFKFKRTGVNASQVTHVRTDATGWVDTASAIASAVFPELMPLILPASQLAKHFMKGGSREDRKAIMRDASRARHKVRTDEMIASMRDIPSVSRAPENVRLQDNLVEALAQNPKPLQDASQPVRFANLPRSNALQAGDVPVLHGQSGNMPMLPVTIQRTENHAVMSGTEFLNTLQLEAAQVGVGLMVQSVELNPRLFPGTKLTAEALTWAKFRFRKFVVEYVPIQGSTITGSFTGYFTPDPSEPDVGGIQAVRNAIEHPHALMFQPFFHSVMAYSEDTVDEKNVYFCRIDPDGDPRLAIQAIFKLVQNVSNATGVAYGQFLVHYEIDFYWPETVAVGVTPSWPSTFVVPTGQTISTTTGLVPSTPFGSNNGGTIYKAIFVSTTATLTNFQFATAPSFSPIPGSTYWLRSLNHETTSMCNLYDTLADAYDGQAEGSLRNVITTASSTNWVFKIIQQISPDSFSVEEEALLGLKTHPKDETPSLKAADFTITHPDHISAQDLPNPTTEAQTRAIRSMLERLKLK